MPAPWRIRIGWRRRSQELKSPTTATRAALGAHTAKRTPLTPSIVSLRAEAPCQFEMTALVEQMQIDIAEQDAKGVWILGLLDGIGPIDSQAIRNPLGNQVFKETVRSPAQVAPGWHRPTGEDST